jgi:quercetin dioxygenase-like cupin family protein
MKTMTIYTDEGNAEWTDVNVRGTVMAKRVVWEGDYGVRSAYFRMPAGMRIESHRHSQWVQVAVLEGRMRVEQADKPARSIGVGNVYFILAGETHAEIAEVDTLLLVTQGEDRPPEMVRKLV